MSERRLIDLDNLLRDLEEQLPMNWTNSDFETGEQFGYEQALNIVKEQPTIDPVKHGKWLQTSKHEWFKDENGDNDENRWFEYFCNGVECEICGKEICVHCNPKYDKAEDCILHYICSECGRVSQKEEPYCHCGAKMDLAERGCCENEPKYNPN